MKYFSAFSFSVLIFPFLYTGCKAQSTYGENYLRLIKIISLPGVKGRIDHMDMDIKNHIVYVSALGSNEAEVVDINNGTVLHKIEGLDEPQGIAFLPQQNEICIANGGTGDVDFYNVANYTKIATIHLKSDADDVHYDSIAHKVYVGYGRGGMAAIDANTHKQTNDIKLRDHPEGFQIDKIHNLLYVNLPGPDVIGVIDLKKNQLIKDIGKNYRSGNFPVALDASGNRLFIGYRHPGNLVIMDALTDKRIRVTDLTNDSDDLFYDEATKRIYVSCGGGYTNLGYINIFQTDGGSSCNQVASIPTRNSARTSLLVPLLHLFIVAEPSVYSHDGELMIYTTAP